MSSLHVLLERVLPLAVLTVALVAVPVMLLSPHGVERVQRLREERRLADEEASRLSEEIRRLRAEVDALEKDPRAIEQVARDELGLVRRTEVVFVFRP